MKAKTQIQITEPCHENWNQMTATEQGRFCHSCQKTVTDFTLMSDKEILHYLSERGADVCGKFSNDQLNRNLGFEYKRKFSLAYVWNIVLATLLSASAAQAQSKPVPAKKTTANNKKIEPRENEYYGSVTFVMPEQLHFVQGVVIDTKTNLPIPFASVFVKGSKSGVAADGNGKFRLNVLFDSNVIVLVVRAVGYNEQEYAVNNKSNNVSFYMDPQVQILGEVAVIAFPQRISSSKLECISGTVGMLVARKEVDFAEKIDRRITDLTPDVIKKKEMKLYPNPVIAGASVIVSLSVKETGEYVMEILDEAGRIVYRGQVSMKSKEKTHTIQTSSSWSKGIYWVRMTGKDSGKIFHSKLVLKEN